MLVLHDVGQFDPLHEFSVVRVEDEDVSRSPPGGRVPAPRARVIRIDGDQVAVVAHC